VINAPHTPAPVETPTPTHPAPVDHGPVFTPQQQQPVEQPQPTQHEPQSPSVFGHDPVPNTPPAHTEPPASHGPLDNAGF
jgi:hypothetical protein